MRYAGAAMWRIFLLRYDRPRLSQCSVLAFMHCKRDYERIRLCRRSIQIHKFGIIVNDLLRNAHMLSR